MENKSEEQLLPEERKGRADSKREVFLLAGDFNIDGIPNLEKSSAKFRDQEEFDMTEFVSYYSRAKQLKLERPAVASLLETKSRYTLMMALLNSGRLMVDDLQVEVLDNKLVTYGESATDRETNKVRTRETALTDAGDQMSEQGLDYIMVANHFPPNDLEAGDFDKGYSYNKQNLSKLRISHINRREFYVQKKKYTQLSDHLRVEAILNLID